MICRNLSVFRLIASCVGLVNSEPGRSPRLVVGRVVATIVGIQARSSPNFKVGRSIKTADTCKRKSKTADTCKRKTADTCKRKSKTADTCKRKSIPQIHQARLQASVNNHITHDLNLYTTLYILKFDTNMKSLQLNGPWAHFERQNSEAAARILQLEAEVRNPWEG